MLSLGQTFDLDPLPADYLMVISYFTFLDLDWSGLAYPVGCLTNGYSARLLIISLVPFIVTAGIMLVAWGRRFTRCQGMLVHRFVQFDKTEPQGHIIELSNSSPTDLAHLSQPRQTPGSEASILGRMSKTASSEEEPVMALYLVLIVIFTFLPNVSRAIFSVWVCVRYESALGAPLVGFLQKDLSIQCDTSEHESLQALAFVLALLWPVGMVGLFVGILICNRKELSAGEAYSTSARAARFLTSGFKDKYFYWELVELMRRLLVSGWVTLIPYDQMFFRAVFVLFISFLLFGLTALAHPWEQPEDNMLALVSQVC